MVNRTNKLVLRRGGCHQDRSTQRLQFLCLPAAVAVVARAYGLSPIDVYLEAATPSTPIIARYCDRPFKRSAFVGRHGGAVPATRPAIEAIAAGDVQTGTGCRVQAKLVKQLPLFPIRWKAVPAFAISDKRWSQKGAKRSSTPKFLKFLMVP